MTYRLKQFIKEFKTESIQIEICLKKVHSVFTHIPKNGGNLLIMPKEKPDTRIKKKSPMTNVFLKLFILGELPPPSNFNISMPDVLQICTNFLFQPQNKATMERCNSQGS